MNYQCPVCSETLSLKDRTWKCVNGHSFDVAKEGYVNLLPVNKKRSKAPGDSKAMLQSRRTFLNEGYYQPLAELLCQSAGTLKSRASILDLGCGEGFYLEFIRKACSKKNHKYSALDISKFAVQMTAKRNPSAHCCVASAVDTPYSDGLFDVIYNVFAPYSEAENYRLLKPQGRFLLVGPGSRHLKELSTRIYDDVVPHAGNKKQLSNNSCFELLNSDELEFQITIPQKQIENLLAMTPYFWSITPERKDVLLAMENLTVTLHFQMLDYLRKDT